MKNKYLGLYDIFLIAGIILCSAIYSIFSVTSGSQTLWDAILGSAASVAGVFCVVLVAKGSIANYLFGVINVSLYAFISFKASIYGDAALNALYYLPMQFIGFYQWRKRGAESAPVKARRLSNMMRIVIALGCIVLIVGGGIILRQLNDPQPFKDAATTVLSIVAQALMSLAFMEQWVLWIITNVLSVTMWSILAYRGEPQAVSMVIMWCFYLLNSINGLRVWLRLSREDAN